MTRTILALYDDLATAQTVVQDIINVGFSRENISIVANDATGNYSKYMAAHPEEGVDDHVGPVEGSAFGAAVGALTGALVTLGALAIPGIGPVIAAGPLVAGLVGAATGAVAGGATGGIVGGLLGLGVPADEAEYYAEGVRRGGTLVSATVNDEWVNRVEEIMNRYNPVNIQERATQWRQSGWTGYSDAATPYTNDDLARERQIYDKPRIDTTTSLDDTQTHDTNLPRDDRSTRV